MDGSSSQRGIKYLIPPETRAVLRRWYRNVEYCLSPVPHIPRCMVNGTVKKKELLSHNDKLHLGCGRTRIRGFINLDCRATAATDMIHDCSDLGIFPDQSFSVVFSQAFFEHLWPRQREECLGHVYRILKPDGLAAFVGIPNFARVAEAYLNKAPGLLGETFDLAHVYRFTHGIVNETVDFERQIPQLHKTLFDKEALENLLKDAGFGSYCLFDYRYKEEKIPISMGFVAWKGGVEGEITRESLGSLLSPYTDGVNVGTIEVLRAVG